MKRTTVRWLLAGFGIFDLLIVAVLLSSTVPTADRLLGSSARGVLCAVFLFMAWSSFRRALFGEAAGDGGNSYPPVRQLDGPESRPR